MLFATVLSTGACSTVPVVSVTRQLDEDADAPYKRILIVTLFDSFDARRYLEDEIVSHLAELGVSAVASTSMMDTKTPVSSETFLKMIDEIGADSLLLTQLTSHYTNHAEKDARPQATYNYWPTYYYNVFQVELTEYVEPPRLETEHSLVLASQVFSVKTREPVWAIESQSVFVEIQEDGLDYRIFVDEANAIVRRMKRDKVVRR
jgi:hypothetical protein